MSNPVFRATATTLLATIGIFPCLAEMRIASQDAVRAATRKPQPEYNPIAKQMRVQGDVEVEAKVSDAGEVIDVKVLSGNSLLTPPVVKAVRDWRFQPFHENGKPCQAIASLRFTFKL